jgi:hypothetical protein
MSIRGTLRQACNYGPDGTATGAPTFVVNGQQQINYLNPQVAAYLAANSDAFTAQAAGANVPLPMSEIPSGCPPGTEITATPAIFPAPTMTAATIPHTTAIPTTLSSFSSVPWYYWAGGAAALFLFLKK